LARTIEITDLIIKVSFNMKSSACVQLGLDYVILLSGYSYPTVNKYARTPTL